MSTFKKRGKIIRKTCKRCNKEFDALAIKIRAGKAKFCNLKCYHSFRTENAKDAAEQRRKHSLKHKYGLSISEYDTILISQNKLCKICNKYMEKPFVDHCHKSNKVRGLLCSSCNSIIGFAYDEIEILQRAIEYLSTLSSVE